MHKLLVDYLKELAANLRFIPKKQREEELLEMQGHLLAAYAKGTEAGLPYEEAARRAIDQFGTACLVGRRTFLAWRREWLCDFAVAALTLLLLLAYAYLALAVRRTGFQPAVVDVLAKYVLPCFIGIAVGCRIANYLGRAAQLTWMLYACLLLGNLVQIMGMLVAVLLQGTVARNQGGMSNIITTAFLPFVMFQCGLSWRMAKHLPVANANKS